MVVPPQEAIAVAVVKALTEHGPLSDDELMDVLVADGIDLGPDPDDMLDEVIEGDYPVMWLSDDRLAWLPALLDGRIFTHRLTAPEVEHDLIFLDPDVAPLALLADDPTYLHLTDGSPMTEVVRVLDGDVLAERGIPDDVPLDDGALLLEPGRFAGLDVTPGDLIGLRVTPRGFELSRVEDTAPSGIAAMIEALLAEDPDEALDLGSEVWTLCAAHDELFRRPSPPLTEEFAAAGLVHEGRLVAAAGYSFGAKRLQRRMEAIAERHDLEDEEALAVLAMMQMYDNVRQLTDLALESDGDPDAFAGSLEQLPWLDSPVGDGSASIGQSIGQSIGESTGEPATPDRRLVASLVALLAEPPVADAVRLETESTDDRAASALALFAEVLEPMAPRQARPALRWLRAVAQDRLGDPEQAEKTLEESESFDPSWPLTLVWLARYASDRGDAARGLDLLRRAKVPRGHPLVELLEEFRSVPRPDLGRNRPCWCGSGRKYKVCHLNRERLPLEQRAAWLYQKGGADLITGQAGTLFVETAQARAAHSTAPDAVVKALDDAIVADAVLFEGGAFDHFLSRRGALLPDDERLLAQQWLLVDRSVHEVVTVRPGLGMTVRDVRTGDVHDVQERTASRQVKPGQLFCGRVVPAGENMQIFGGLEPVSVGERDTLIALLDDEPGPVELVEFLSRRFAPPQLRNTEGESLTLGEATLRVADPVAVAAALDEEYERRDDLLDGQAGWHEHVTTDGMERIRASLELSGDELHIEANSEARLDRVLRTVRDIDPSALTLTDKREPAGDLTTMQRLADRGPARPGPVLDPHSDPALAAALEAFIAQQEKSWVDESIPALAGYTPRQCAADPTRRPDLIALLDSFPEDNGRPGMMSPARLKVALGLA